MNKRFKELVNYPQKINEEMKVAPEFTNKQFDESKPDQISLIVSEDDVNDREHMFHLIVQYIPPTEKTLPGLQYSFMLTDKDYKVIDSSFNKNLSDKYLPQEIKGKRMILPLVDEMVEKLLKKKSPDRFYMKSNEPMNDALIQKRYGSLVGAINKIGYDIERGEYEKGTNKYLWVFKKKSITESNNDYLIGEDFTEKQLFEYLKGIYG